MAPTFRISPGQASVFVVVVLIGINVLDIKVEHASLVVAPVGGAVLVATARLAGLSWEELGFRHVRECGDRHEVVHRALTMARWRLGIRQECSELSHHPRKLGEDNALSHFAFAG